MIFSRPTRRKRKRRRALARFETLESRRLLATYFVDANADNTTGTCAADNATANDNCTIRLAVQQAEANAGADTIQIADGNYVIDSAIGSFDLSNAQDTTFIGNATDATAVVIDGDFQSRVFDIFGGGATYSVSFQGLTIQNGIARDGSGGGGINAAGEVNLSLDNVIVQASTAAENSFNPGEFSSGGGIQASGNVSIINSTIRDNTATIDGGGIHYVASDNTKTLSVSDSTISGNTAAIVGGGIDLEDTQSTATLDNVVFANNLGPASGGGVYSDGATISVSNSTFTGNRAPTALSGGGGLYILGQSGTGAFTVTNTNFQNNEAVDGAGGLEILNAAGSISGGTFSNNLVTGVGSSFDQGGGGIVVLGNQTGSPPAVSISGVTIQNNTAPAAGGIALVDANVTISDSFILNNSASSTLVGGGGIGAFNSVQGSPLTIERTRIAGNSTAGSGAGVGTVDVSLQITDTTIDGNSANGGSAAGIGVFGNMQTPVVAIASSTISNNLASADGGGIGVSAAAMQLTNVTVTANTADVNGGGIAYDNSSGVIQSFISFSTIADNSGLAGGNNLAALGTAAVSIDNSIFALGGCAISPGSATSGGFNIDSGLTCGFGQPTDRGNTDPVLGPLQDNGGPVFTLALGAGSPAIDTADSNFPATDARGITRPQDGNGDLTSAADVGAYEGELTGQPKLSIGDVFFEESNGNATVLVTLDSAVAGGPFSVDFTTVDDTATDPNDYLANSGTLNFNGTAGEQQPITISIVNDDVAENDEQFQVTLSNPTTSVDISDVGIVSVFDDDGVTLTVDDPSLNEDSGTISLSVTLSGRTDASFTVDVATVDRFGGAVAGTDYTATTETLTFAGNDGETQTFTVSLTADTTVELDEVFGVEVKNISAGIRDIEFDNFADRVDFTSAGQFAPGGISANDVALFTPDPFTTIAYVADASGLLVLDVSDPAAVVQLGAFPLGDEALQVLSVDVSFFNHVVYIAAGNAGLEILDVSDPANITRLGSFSATGQRALTLDRDGGTIYLGESDAAQTNGGLRILDVSDPANITQLSFFQTNIPAALDVLVEGTTAFVAASTGGLQVIDVSNPVAPAPLGSFDTQTARFVEVADDIGYIGTPTGLSILDVTDPAAITELGTFATAGPVNAIDPDDERSGAVVVVTDESGTTQVLQTADPSNIGVLGTFSLATPARGFDVEGLLAYVASSTGGVQILRGDLVAEATATILNDDSAVISINDISVDEGSGTATLTVSVDHAVDGGFTVDVATNDGSATDPGDYSSTNATLTFSGAASESQVFTIPITSDAVSEATELFAVSLSNVIPFGNLSASLIDATDVGTVTITETLGQVDLSVTGDTFDDRPQAGGFLFDTFTIVNVSTTDATGVTVLIDLDPNVTFDSVFSSSDATFTQNGNQLSATIGNLAAGATEIIDVSATVNENAVGSTLLTSTLTANSMQTDIDPSDNSAQAINSVLEIHTLTTGNGDGDVTIDVDAFGTFGSSALGFAESTADYDPIGPIQNASAVFLSTLAVRESTTGSRTFLNQIPVDQIQPSSITGDATTASSNFSIGTLDVQVIQSVLPNFDSAGTRIGALLEQTYTFTTTSVSPTPLDVVRYTDADLLFDQSLLDGGGRLTGQNGELMLFETDAGGTGATDTTFVGITSSGGSSPTQDLFMVEDFGDLLDRVSDGTPLQDSVANDTDGDGFVDAGSEFDVGLALRHLLNLSPGQAAQYTTTTFFGSRPSSVIDPDPTTIQGHITCDINGNETEDLGEAVVGTTVFLDADGNRILNAGEQSTLTDSAGNYSFADVTDSSLTVVVQVPSGCNTIPTNPGLARAVNDVGDLARAITSVDVDNDGDRDLLVASDGDRSNSVTVLVNNAGDFTFSQEIKLGNRPQSIFAWESPQLSAPLIAVAGVGTPSDGGSIARIDGTQEMSPLAAGNGPIDVAIDDFDGNGQPDIVSASFRSSDVQLFLNGSTEPTTIATARQVRAVEAGDINGDGHSDVIVGGFGFPDDDSSQLVVRLGDGNGDFAEPIEISPTERLIAAKVVDLTTDPDALDSRLFVLAADGQLTIYAMQNGSLEAVDAIDAGDGLTSFDVGDFNRDGLVDVAIASLGRQVIDLYVGNGEGQFAHIKTFTNVLAPSDIVVDDFDGDGADDIAVANLYGRNQGQAGSQQYVLPSTVTILRLDVAESQFVISGSSVTQVDFSFPTADPAIRLDVTGEGEVTALDALRIINSLGRTVVEGENIWSADHQTTDVNGDGRTSAVDALMVINYLSRHQPSASPGAAIDQLIEDDDDDREERTAAVDVVLTHLLS